MTELITVTVKNESSSQFNWSDIPCYHSHTFAEIKSQITLTSGATFKPVRADTIYYCYTDNNITTLERNYVCESERRVLVRFGHVNVCCRTGGRNAVAYNSAV